MKYPSRFISLAVLGIAAFSFGGSPVNAGDRDRHSFGRDSHWRDSQRHDRRHDHYRDRDRHDRHYRHYDRYHFGRHSGLTFSTRRPGTSFSVSVGSYYHSPRYYRSPIIYSHRYYGPRFGTIVTRLPLGCERVYYGRRTYYHFNNVYYAPSSAGYVVVDPATFAQDAAPTAAETREAVRRALETASPTVTEPSAPAIEEAEAVAPLEYLPSGYRTHYVGGAPIYEVDGQFYRWSPERHAYIAAPAPTE